MNKITYRLAFAATLGVAALASQSRAQLISYSIANNSWTPAGNNALYLNTSTTPHSWDAFIGVGTGTGVNPATIQSQFPGIVPSNFGNPGTGGTAAPTIIGYVSNGGSAGDTVNQSLDVGSFQFWNGVTSPNSTPVAVSYDLKTTITDGSYTAVVDVGTFTWDLTNVAGIGDEVTLASITGGAFGNYTYGQNFGALETPVSVTFTDGSLTATSDVKFTVPLSDELLEASGQGTLAGLAGFSGTSNYLAVASNTTDATGDFDLQVSSQLPYLGVPEPSTYTLWGAAVLLAFIGYRRMSAAKNAVSIA